VESGFKLPLRLTKGLLLHFPSIHALKALLIRIIIILTVPMAVAGAYSRHGYFNMEYL
jgi:hypothetical protein